MAEPSGTGDAPDAGPRPGGRQRKAMLLRLDPDLHDALAAWAADELRSTNSHIEFLLRQAVHKAGRRPRPRRRD